MSLTDDGAIELLHRVNHIEDITHLGGGEVGLVIITRNDRIEIHKELGNFLDLHRKKREERGKRR